MVDSLEAGVWAADHMVSLVGSQRAANVSLKSHLLVLLLLCLLGPNVLNGAAYIQGGFSFLRK